MKTKTTDRRRELIEILQEQIAKIDEEIERLNKDKTLYHHLIEGITSNNSDYDSSQSIEISIEVNQDNEEKSDNSYISKQRKKVKEERQVAFEKARAWALDRRRNKNFK
jgi:hypothetical protein